MSPEVGPASRRHLLPSARPLPTPAAPGRSQRLRGLQLLGTGASHTAASDLSREHGLLSYFLHGLRYSKAAVQSSASTGSHVHATSSP